MACLRAAGMPLRDLGQENPQLTRAGSRARLDRYVRDLDAPQLAEEIPAPKPA
jgi:hypothetical protein